MTDWIATLGAILTDMRNDLARPIEAGWIFVSLNCDAIYRLVNEPDDR
jgi:hypothetical protein